MTVQAVPIWNVFIECAQKVIDGATGHAASRQAWSYLLNHRMTFQSCCKDGKLSISDFPSEHVARTIALARRNSLFAMTQSRIHAGTHLSPSFSPRTLEKLLTSSLTYGQLIVNNHQGDN